MTLQEEISILREALAIEKENILKLKVGHQGLEDLHRIVLDANDGLRDQIHKQGEQIAAQEACLAEQEAKIASLKRQIEDALKTR